MIKVKAVISIKRVSDSYLPRTYFKPVLIQGIPVDVQTGFKHTINTLTVGLHETLSLIGRS
jgi:hypothetical protein